MFYAGTGGVCFPRGINRGPSAFRQGGYKKQGLKSLFETQLHGYLVLVRFARMAEAEFFVKLSDDAAGLPLLPAVGPHIMGQVDEHEQDGPDQQQGCKQAKVAQGRGFQRDQCQECAHRRDVAHDQGRDDLLDCLPPVGLECRMGYQMQGIIDGYAEDYAGNADDYDVL